MGTKISWADESWNPIVGCSKISAGCANCYAEKMAHRQAHMEIKRGAPDMYGDVLTVCGKWDGTTKFVESALTKPRHWRNPRKIFVCSMSDLFHESVPFEWVDRVFGAIDDVRSYRELRFLQNHTYMILTKRAQRMREYFSGGSKYTFYPNWQSHVLTGHEIPIGHVHLGVTVENQDNVGRIDDLVRTPAAKRFLSIEPMLEDIAFRQRRLEHIDYVYLGCESNGPPERLCSLDDMVHQMKRCWRAGVKIHVKQIPLNGKCNKNINEWPKEFRVREV